MLSHLVYVSVRKEECTDEEIDKIFGCLQKKQS